MKIFFDIEQHEYNHFLLINWELCLIVSQIEQIVDETRLYSSMNDAMSFMKTNDSVKTSMLLVFFFVFNLDLWFRIESVIYSPSNILLAKEKHQNSAEVWDKVDGEFYRRVCIVE